MFNHTKGLARLVECWSAAQDVVGSIPRPNQYLGFFNSWSYLLFPIKYFDRTFSWLEGPCRTGSLMSSRKYIKRWGVTKTQTLDPRKTLTSGCLENWDFQLCISQFQLCPAPPRATAGHLPALSVPGVGHLQILCCPGAGHLPTPGPFLSFCLPRGFLSENNYTEDFTGKESRLAHLSRTGKMEEVCKGMFLILCMHFFIAYRARIT